MTEARRNWLLFAGYVALLAASIPVGPGIVVALRQQALLGHAVSAVYFGSAALLAYYVLFDVRLSDRVAFWSLVLLAAIAGAFLLGLRVPEERIHFLQYGVLALIARGALARDRAPRSASLAAFALASLISVADEVLQGWLPARVFDLRDIGLNAVGAALALAGEDVLHRRTGLEAGPRR